MLGEETGSTNELLQHFVVLIASLIVSLFTTWIAWKKGFFRWPTQAFVPYVTGWEVLKGFGLFIFMQMILVPALIVVFFTLMDPTFTPSNASVRLSTNGWFSFFLILGSAVGVLFVFFTLPQAQRHLIWGDNASWKQNLLWGVTAWLISYPIVIALGQFIMIMMLYLFNEVPVDQVAVKHLKQLKSDPMLLTLTAITVVCVVPVIEEILFRGLLQTWIKRKIKRVGWAIIATSLIFAFFHFSVTQGITNIELIASLFVLSCFLGFLYERQQSLWAPIGLHAFFNAISVLLIINS